MVEREEEKINGDHHASAGRGASFSFSFFLSLSFFLPLSISLCLPAFLPSFHTHSMQSSWARGGTPAAAVRFLTHCVIAGTPKPQFLHLKNEAVTFAFSARQDCGDIPMGCTGTLPENKDYWDSIWTHRIPLVIPATL